jgi:uncharacterized protein
LRGRNPGPGKAKKFVDMTDSEIAQVIAARNQLSCKVTEGSLKHSLVVQKNQDEATFLKERAARIDFDCYIQVDPETGKDTLFFIKPTDARDGDKVRVYVFEWGVSLISFAPQLKLSNQVGSVTVRGWDPRTKQPISYTARPSDLPGAASGRGMSGPQAAESRLGGKSNIVVDQPVISAEEARNLAVSRLRERAYEYITGNGQVIGLPDLRPGDNVEIKGLGNRFSGMYYVTKVEHSLGNSGYLTQFWARRDRDGGLT